jgi:hypothetical protein
MTDVSAPQFVLEQPASRAATILSAAVFMPAACSIFIPLGMVAAHADTVAVAAQQNPLAAVQVAVGVALWTGLFIVPVVRKLRRLGLSRSLRIDGGRVVETTQTLFGTHRTDRPLTAFAGIVHRIRTSVGGIAHELALVERGTGREVVFQVGSRLDRPAVDDALARLGLKEIKAADLARLPAARDVLRFDSGCPDVPAAA